MAKKIVYGSHADEKFEIFEETWARRIQTSGQRNVAEAGEIEEGFRGRKIAQRRISEKHVLRVVYEEGQREIRVVTFYPGRRSRYESSI